MSKVSEILAKEFDIAIPEGKIVIAIKPYLSTGIFTRSITERLLLDMFTLLEEQEIAIAQLQSSYATLANGAKRDAQRPVQSPKK